MQRLSPSSLNVLKALSYFHFLTNDQLVSLGIAKSSHSLEEWALKALTPRRSKDGVLIDDSKKLSRYLVRNLRFGKVKPNLKQVKFPYIHYLTKAGANYLYDACEDELLNDEIWFPTPTDQLSNEYFHRIEHVWTHMAFRAWAQSVNAEIDFITHDYQGDPNRPKVRMRPVSVNNVIWNQQTGERAKPDMIAGISHNGRSRLFTIEVHNETPTKQVRDQIFRNFKAGQAIRAKFPEYPTKNDPFVLSVYASFADHQGRTWNNIDNVRKRIADDPAFAGVLKGLLFAKLDDLKTDFENAWTYADGSKAKLFPTV